MSEVPASGSISKCQNDTLELILWKQNDTLKIMFAKYLHFTNIYAIIFTIAIARNINYKLTFQLLLWNFDVLRDNYVQRQKLTIT